MGIVGIGNKCYLYVNGVSVSEPLELHDNVILYPANPIVKWNEIGSLFDNDIDFFYFEQVDMLNQIHF